MDTQESTVEAGRGPLVSRRAVAIGAAWTVPVIITAVAAPSASASVLPALSATGTLTKVKASDYTLRLLFTPPAGSSEIITITSVVAASGNPPSTFDEVPQSQTQTVTTASPYAVFSLSRNGDNKSVTALVTYQVNGGPAQQVPVSIVGT